MAQPPYVRLDDKGLDHLVSLIKRDMQKKMTEGNNIAIDEDKISVSEFATNLEIDNLFRGGI